MPLYVVSHSPTINATGVYRNPTIEVEFNKTLLSTSIDSRVISLHDKNYNIIVGTITPGYTNAGTSSGSLNKIFFTPDSYLLPSTIYNVYLHKQPESVLSIDNDGLSDNYRFSFTTGAGTTDHISPTTNEVLEIDLARAVELENWEEAARIQRLIDTYGSGITPEITTSLTEAVPLNVVDVWPKNGTPGVDANIPFIKITFNDGLRISGVSIYDYIDVSYKNILDD